MEEEKRIKRSGKKRSEKSGEKSYKLIYQWITEPKEFFISIVDKFNKQKKGKQQLFLLLSFLLPIIFGISLYLFFIPFPVNIIAGSYLGPTILIIVFIILSFLIVINFLLYSPGLSGYFYFKKRLKPVIEKKIDIKSKKMRRIIFNKAVIFRNNFYFLPLISIFLGSSLATPERAWNIYYLGLYLGLILLISLLWTVIFIIVSASSMNQVYMSYILRKYPESPKVNIDGVNVPKHQYLILGLIALTIGLLFYMIIDLLLDMWLGASSRALWDKIAMAFLHGQ